MLNASQFLGFYSYRIPTSRMLFSFVASATSTASTITIPSTARSGDFAVLLDAARNSSGNPTTVVPSGWTSERNDVVGVLRGIISRKTLAGGDPGASITGMNGNGVIPNTKLMMVFRANKTISSVTAGTSTGEATTGNPAPQTIAIAGLTPPIIAIAHFKTSDNPVDPRSNTPVPPSGELQGGNANQYGQFMLYPFTPSDHIIDMDDEGAGNCLQSVNFRFT